MTREERVAAASLVVLSTEGMRGLTHRAVDEAAGLPEGSTSNVARTRAALLGVSAAKLAATDVARLGALAGVLPSTFPSRRDAAGLLASLVARRGLTDATTTAARFELQLEARRRPDLARELEPARRAFESLAIAVLVRSGCADPHGHAAPLIALVEGLVANALLVPATPLSADEVRATFERWLANC